jgi:lysylphosphatidylglycerol synthetase-like protein (DUF2156 family)
MKFIRIGVCVLIAFAVIAFGAVEEWSQAVLAVGASLLLVYWSLLVYRQRSEQIAVSHFFLPRPGRAASKVACEHLNKSDYGQEVFL